MRLLFSTLFLAISLNSYCQFTDDFSDLDFVTGTYWIGDSLEFTAASGLLRLNAPPLSDTSCLSTSSEVALNSEWRFSAILDFNPSSSNFCRIYLMSDKADLKANCNGYYIKIGGTEDEISLYRQDGNTSVLVIDGRDGALNSNSVTVNIVAKRDSAFQWHLLRDTTGGTNYIAEDTAIDSTYKASSHFGVFCKYTSTRCDKFSFDNFSAIGEVFTDTEAPFIIGDSITSSSTWIFGFSEKLDKACLIPSNFTQLNSGNKALSILTDTSLTSIIVNFESAFQHGKMTCIEIRNVRDVAGNKADSVVVCRLYSSYAMVPFKGIVISEVMPDPEPVLSLPPVEYIEILNRTKAALRLDGWHLTDGKDSCGIKIDFLQPESYVLLCDINDSVQWLSYDVVKCFCDMPSLNNDKDTFMLLDPSGRLVDSMAYTLAQFNTSSIEGGISLELRDTAFLCTDTSNWALSRSALGGSPGLPNTIPEMNERENPGISFVDVVSDSLIRLKLKGHPQPDFPLIQYLSFQPEIEVGQAQIMPGNFMDIKPISMLEANEKYKVRIALMAGCYGDTIDELVTEFINPGKLDSGDLRINEVLFNPAQGGFDFVELYNASADYIDLGGIAFINGQGDTVGDTWTERYGREILEPGHFIVFTEDSDYIATRYISSSTDRIRNADLTSWNDDFGSVGILNGENEVMDLMFYSESMHFPLIEEDEGIALERISPLTSATDRRNWTSASSSSGYATPGLENSQYLAGVSGHFNISPGIFSPDNDGYQDLISINYGIPKAGCAGSIVIYDDEGRVIRELVSNEILGAEGFYTWNGIDRNNQKARIGYYLVIFEYICTDGEYGKERASLVLAHKLE